MSGSFSRSKGSRSERNIVNILKDAGIPAKRISMMETNSEDKGDIELMGIYHGQCKAGDHVPATVYKFMENGEEFLFMKRNRREWLVTMKLEFFLDKFI